MTSPRSSLPRTLVVLSAGLLGACGSAPESITLVEPGERLLRRPGQSVQLEYLAHDARGRRLAEPRVKWVSSAPEVATVADGVVTAVKSGRAVVEVAGGRGRASVSFVVSIPGSLEVRASGVDFLEAGRSVKVSATVKDELGRLLRDAEVEWETSDAAIARIEGERILGIAAGRAVITASAGPLRRSFPVRVVPADFTRLSLSHTRHTFEKRGQSMRLKASALNSRGAPLEGVPMEWFTSDAAVVRVSDAGEVTAVGPGRAVVSVTAGRKRSAVEFVVR
ncbi:Ig-like domain-containing protein [Myxococcaceae bacterium GXIMD 01537]